MKLYATTTSERASKGQGGNDKLYIDVNIGDIQKMLQININRSPTLKCYILSIGYNNKIILNDNIYHCYEEETKQKGKHNCDCYNGSINKPCDIDCNSRKGKQKKGECNQIPCWCGNCNK